MPQAETVFSKGAQPFCSKGTSFRHFYTWKCSAKQRQMWDNGDGEKWGQVQSKCAGQTQTNRAPPAMAGEVRQPGTRRLVPIG